MCLAQLEISVFSSLCLVLKQTQGDPGDLDELARWAGVPSDVGSLRRLFIILTPPRFACMEQPASREGF